MRRAYWFSLAGLVVCLVSLSAPAQTDKIVIAAGSPEDQALSAISNEQDPQKKAAMYEDFLQKFSSNPEAVAYGNWQLAQTYQTAGDLGKALAYGDKALAASPRNMDILVLQTTIAQQLKEDAKVIAYATKGGEIYNTLDKQEKPAGMEDQDFANRVQDDKNSAKGSYEFLEAAAFNAIADERDAKKRMDYIERFTPAFPNSRFQEPVASYAMMSLAELKDTPRLIAYGEKTLATNSNSLPTLLLMANAYVDDPKPGSVNEAIRYAQKAIEVAKADAPDADSKRKMSAGVAHSTLGYALMKQNKTASAVGELKTASTLLKGQDDQSYAVAMYRLGFAYAKLNKVTEAREVLSEVVKMPGPVQQPAQDLLAKVNAARAKEK
jgi:tetratricopeptide (TPR) repeat protein